MRKQTNGLREIGLNQLLQFMLTIFANLISMVALNVALNNEPLCINEHHNHY